MSYSISRGLLHLGAGRRGGGNWLRSIRRQQLLIQTKGHEKGHGPDVAAGASIVEDSEWVLPHFWGSIDVARW